MRCPNCNNRVLQKSGSETRLRTQGPITFGNDGKARAKCFWCKSEVVIEDVQLRKGADVAEERFVLAETKP